MASGTASKCGPPASVASHNSSPASAERMKAKRPPSAAHAGDRPPPCSGLSAVRTDRSIRSIDISTSVTCPLSSRRSDVSKVRAPGRHAAGAAARVGTSTVRPSAMPTMRNPPSSGDTNATHAPSDDQRGSKPITSCWRSGRSSPLTGSSSQGRGGNGSRRCEKTMAVPSGAQRAALHSASPQSSSSREPPPCRSTSQRSAANTSVPSVATSVPPSGARSKSRTGCSNDASVCSSPTRSGPSPPPAITVRAAMRVRSAAPSVTYAMRSVPVSKLHCSGARSRRPEAARSVPSRRTV